MRRWWSAVLAVDSGDPDYDRRARTLNAIVLFAFVGSLVAAVAVLPFRDGRISSLVLLIGASCLLGILGLSHSGRLAMAVTLLAIVLWLFTVIQPVVTGDLSTNVVVVPLGAVMLVYVLPGRFLGWVALWVGSALLVLLFATDDVDTVPVPRFLWIANTAIATAVTVSVVVYGARQLARSVRREHELAQELSARERTMQRLEELATTDPLTGFLNRRALEHDFPAIGPGAAVALIDIDRFKGVNDAFSHATGDRVLADVSAVLAETAEMNDRLYRLGGDEFLVVRQPSTAVGLAEWLHTARARLRSRASVQRVTFSGGVVDVAGDDLSATLTRADRAMYAAKQAGRDAIVVID
ncbi:MAG: GGDEF domain-containing protein [Candidatus Nanopelagicales bacterium]